MDRGICHLSQIPVRGEAKSSAEMVTQLIFGETYDILEIIDDWYRIQMHYDGYQGWLSYPSIKEWEGRSTNTAIALYEDIENDINDGRVMSSMGAEIVQLPDTKIPFVTELAKRFIGVPYLWGGRHFSGIDCSGFVQIVYKVLGLQLPRDASQQQKKGKPVRFEDLFAGDLVFFEKNGRIGHVGLLYSPGKIIHSHGHVRIDTLTKEGITNTETGELTHSYHSAKRVR